MRRCKTRLLWVGLFFACLTECVFCAGAAAGREYTGDFVLDREIPVNLVAGTAERPRLVAIEWIRIEAKYGNAWGVTARVGWSSAAEATWRLRLELLDGQGRVLRHARDTPTVFMGRASGGNGGPLHYADVDLEPVQWDARRHVSKVRLILEPVPDPAPEDSAGHSLVLVALDGQDEKPIPEATVITTVRYQTGQPRARTMLSCTDARGECRIALAKPGLASVAVLVQKDGYATMATSWSNRSSWPVAGGIPLMELPERHVVEMAAARTIGGIVRDPQGRPIAGVEVMVEGYVAEVGGLVSIRPRVLTDSEGRWRAGGVVGDIDRLSLGFRHPEYAGDNFANRHLLADQIAPVLAGEYVVVLNKGLVVRGAVLDEQGNPVPGAAVILAPRRYGRFCDEYAWAVTDSAGRFRFDCATDDRTDTTRDGGSTAVIVESPGHTPMMKQIVVEPNVAPLEFRLKPGRSLALRVVGPDDRPITGAWMVWHPLLEDPRYDQWLADTDEQGRLRISDAPETEVRMEILKSGYVSIRDLSLFASSEEHVVKLRPAPCVQGTVADAETGGPIKDFEVGTEFTTAGRQNTSHPSHFQDGKFTLSFDEAEPTTVQLRISARGYAPTTSESISLEGTRALEFKLAKDSLFQADASARGSACATDDGLAVIKGVVQDPNDRPIPNVRVILLADSWSAMDATTDGEGRFKLRCQQMQRSAGPQATPLVAVRDSQRNLAAAVECDPATAENLAIRTTPGTILHGTVTNEKSGAIPGAQVSLIFWNGHAGHTLRDSVKSHPDGSYEISGLPGGHRYSVVATAEGYGQTYIDIDAAEGADAPTRMDPLVLCVANLDVTGTAVDIDDNPVPNARVFFYGRNQRNQETRTDTEGRFTAHNICAGDVQIQANTMGTSNLHGMVQTEGGATVKIVMTAMSPGGQPVLAQPRSLVGKPLPSLADLDAGLLADAYQGKMVLLCFFDLSQRPSRHCLDILATQADKLRDQGVAIAAIQAAATEEDAWESWLAERGTKIPFGRIGKDIGRAKSIWGVGSLPWLILTGRDGIVQAEGFAPDELQNRIEAVAKEPVAGS
jgi:hypothetical protein